MNGVCVCVFVCVRVRACVCVRACACVCEWPGSLMREDGVWDMHPVWWRLDARIQAGCTEHRLRQPMMACGTHGPPSPETYWLHRHFQ
jgi:hypothetical protein